MKIGIPAEIKPFEKRVALLPAAVAELTAMGHDVFLQSGAGTGSGYDDLSYTAAAAIVNCVHRVAVIDEVLNQSSIANP